MLTLTRYWEQQLDRRQAALIKIDVEGFENGVMTGAAGMLAKAPPLVLLVELQPSVEVSFFGEGPGQLLRQLARAGYQNALCVVRNSEPVSMHPLSAELV